MINEFKNDFRFLSNFYLFEKEMKYGCVSFKSVEAFFVGMKSKDWAYRKRVAEEFNMGEVKRLGRSVKLRKDWFEIKRDVMLFGLRYKFGNENKGLKEKLLATGNEMLVEGNWWNDKYWGICLKSGEGRNELGKLLMKVREEIRG
jgi:ribA/ribD-fused uncharacterized protein